MARTSGLLLLAPYSTSNRSTPAFRCAVREKKANSPVLVAVSSMTPPPRIGMPVAALSCRTMSNPRRSASLS
jgi:hypothetical protein